ncbi:MAG: lysostaphin resistance A-like protein [Acidobacteriaceae bacterium]
MPEPDQPAEHEPQPNESVERLDAFGEESAPPIPPPPGLPSREVFVGRDGLRAGWSLLIYFVVIFALVAGGRVLIGALRHHATVAKPAAAAQSSKPSAPAQDAPMPIGTLLIAEGISLFVVAVATWVMGKIERKPYSVYGLGGIRRLPNFLAGVGWGVAMLSLLVLALRASGLLVFDARELFGPSAWRYGTLWFAGFLLVGLFEEYGFRGYLQFTLARGINGLYAWLGSFGSQATGQRSNGQNAPGFWIAAVLISFGFGFVHHTNAGESPIGLLSAGLISVIFCLSLWRTGSLWWAIGFHAAWDWSESFLYGVSDSGVVVQNHLFNTHPLGSPLYSGGLTGPEGSIYILPILACAAAIILLTLPDSRHKQAASTSEPMLD